MFKTRSNAVGRLSRFVAAVILCLGSVMAFAAGQKPVTINMTDVPLEQVMRSIEQQTDYVFLNKNIDVARKVSLNVSGMSVESALQVLFDGTDVDYEIESGHIVISKKNSSSVAGGGQIGR